MNRTVIAAAALLGGALLGTHLVARLSAPESARVRAPIAQARPDLRLDPDLSLPYYAVREGAFIYEPRAGETPEQTAALTAIAREVYMTYAARVNEMVACMNRPDDVRQAHCTAMEGFVHPSFKHTEGRAAGFRVRHLAGLRAAGQARAFQMNGFFALTIRVTMDGPDEGQVLTCYFHDQWNDPDVKGTEILATGNLAVYRTSVETIKRDPDGRLRIRTHIALDARPELVTKGCAGNG